MLCAGVVWRGVIQCSSIQLRIRLRSVISDQFISYHFCFAFQAPRAVVETVLTMQALNVYAMENYGIGKKYVCFLSLFCACLFLLPFFCVALFVSLVCLLLCGLRLHTNMKNGLTSSLAQIFRTSSNVKVGVESQGRIRKSKATQAKGGVRKQRAQTRCGRRAARSPARTPARPTAEGE